MRLSFFLLSLSLSLSFFLLAAAVVGAVSHQWPSIESRAFVESSLNLKVIFFSLVNDPSAFFFFFFLAAVFACVFLVGAPCKRSLLEGFRRIGEVYIKRIEATTFVVVVVVVAIVSDFPRPSAVPKNET